jgi:hypothetical protein
MALAPAAAASGPRAGEAGREVDPGGPGPPADAGPGLARATMAATLRRVCCAGAGGRGGPQAGHVINEVVLLCGPDVARANLSDSDGHGATRTGRSAVRPGTAHPSPARRAWLAG